MKAVVLKWQKGRAEVVENKFFDSLTFMQDVVDGYIECPKIDIGLPPGYCVVVNEDGNIFHLPVNISASPVKREGREVWYSLPILRGHVAVIGVDEKGEFTSVKDEDIPAIKKALEVRKLPVWLVI